MSNLIKNLRIQNFKSIKDLSLDCERINVFIGRPNAGKSNILEAVSLLGVNYEEINNKKFLESTIRYRLLNHFFNNFNVKEPIKVNADFETVVTFEEAPSTLPEEHKYDFIFKKSFLSKKLTEPVREKTNPSTFVIKLYSDGKIMGGNNLDGPPLSSIKRYEFNGLLETQLNGLYLKPPHGENFYSIVETHPPIREEIKQFLAPNGLELLLDINSRRMTVVQRTEDTLISFPLTLVPDTFQRYIFHLAAIMSNRDSVLLFEEPESHSYGPYIYELAQHMLNDEGGNQFFLTTHNPYFLLPLLQEGKDVAVFTTWFENYETHAKRLTQEEIREILDYGIDLFLNLDHFIPA